MLILIAITEMVYEWQLHVITSFLSQILQSFLWQVQGHLQRQKMMLEEILPQLPQNAYQHQGKTTIRGQEASKCKPGSFMHNGKSNFLIYEHIRQLRNRKL
uniref:Uncharacterized protein n=1 Tax=Rhizophora mucronata TaxID=61149 RepID=A0A2P2JJV5_RHIMU